MPVNVELDELAFAMERMPEDGTPAFLDLKTGEVVYLSDFDVTGVDDSELRAQIGEEPDRFEEVPRLDSHQEYDWMSRFAETQADPVTQRQLRRALEGKGAFRRFREALGQLGGLKHEWLQFRDEQLEREVLQWLGDRAKEVTLKRRAPPPEVARPQQPRKASLLPLRLLQALVLGEGSPVIEDGKVRRVIKAGSRNVRELYKQLVKDLCVLKGQEWRNRFIENDAFGFEDTWVLLRGDEVWIEVVIPEAVEQWHRAR